ncbi:hypothetical protein [Chitinophaga varians]|uniref:hypothetical protein n=1 Tax=Chitinophaga varians TaxID=2202339 RepID=UPI00165F5510|nr:hypothetical protein [Chitinophaga varians]MBC9913849.1 hypothetical protein [Chitinophaga varians]
MRYMFTFLVLLCTMSALGQAVFPKGFKLIKADNLTGSDDRYSNGKEVFQMHMYFRSYDGDYNWNDDKYKQHIAESTGYPMYRTKDSLLWGTGKVDGYYSYTVIDWHGETFELFSQNNDAGFSYYSKWLIEAIRDYRKRGKVFMFERRFRMLYTTK